MSSKVGNGKKWAIILGASSGFGAASSLELAKSGINIFGIHFDRRAAMPSIRKLRSKIRATGVKEMYFNFNAADDKKREEALLTLKKETKGEKNPVKLLMHSLAFGSLVPYVGKKGEGNIVKKQMELTLDVMAHSLVYWTQALISHRLLGAGGQILSMTSAGSHVVWHAYGAVSAAKAALESHTRQLAIELTHRKIAVNCIQAGVTDTPALRKIPRNEKIIEAALRINPNDRLTRPQDVAKIITMIANHGTPWMTGNIIRVDGGEDITG